MTPIEVKVQEKLNELVAKYEKQRKSASSGSQSYDRCISTVNEIKHFKSFAKEFLDIEIDFWRQQKNQYDPGTIEVCKIVSKEDISIEDHER